MNAPALLAPLAAFRYGEATLALILLAAAAIIVCLGIYAAIMWAKVPFEIRTIRETLQRIEASRKSAVAKESPFPKLDPEPAEAS